MLRDLENHRSGHSQQSPWQHHRNHTQVPTDTTSAKVKWPKRTKVAPYPAPN